MTAYDNDHMMARISLADIDYADRYYKISRNRIDDDLRSSIAEFGVLDPPALIGGGAAPYRVVFGFNRLEALRDAGAESAEALVMETVDPEWYIGRAVLKSLRNECGPMGRIRVHAIMKELGVEQGRLEVIAKKCLHLPGEFTRDGSLAVRAGGLPGPLKDYCDCRDIHFRVIRDLLRLPSSAHDALSKWISYAPMKVNIFRFIIDMLTDMVIRDGGIGFVSDIVPDESTDRKQWEEQLFDRIREARYPEYSAIRSRADDIVRYFAAHGIQVGYPPYFEGDRLDLTMQLGRRDDPFSVRKKIDEADLSKLKELLELL